MWLVTLTLGACSLGCGLRERAEACDRTAKALEAPAPAKKRTSKPAQLEAGAQTFEAAAQRLGDVKQLPPELETIAKQATQQLSAVAKELRAAARARRAARAPEYAGARLRAEAAQRVLAELSGRFGKFCSR